jgi:hypothetical protein
MFCFVLGYWGLNSVPTTSATPPALFCDFFFFFLDRASQTICPDWHQHPDQKRNSYMHKLKPLWHCRICLELYNCFQEKLLKD